MDYPASTAAAALTTQGTPNARAGRLIGLWILTAAFLVTAVAVVLADAALTPEQRITAFVEAGMYP